MMISLSGNNLLPEVGAFSPLSLPVIVCNFLSLSVRHCLSVFLYVGMHACFDVCMHAWMYVM